jgi:hypothetical protein
MRERERSGTIDSFVNQGRNSKIKIKIPLNAFAIAKYREIERRREKILRRGGTAKKFCTVCFYILFF